MTMNTRTDHTKTTTAADRRHEQARAHNEETGATGAIGAYGGSTGTTGPTGATGAAAAKAAKAAAAKEWKPAFPPPSDGKYEVKMGDKIVKVTRRDGTWKLPDGRSVNVSEWR
jgi:hypothetical protein